jgi:hypothetical protein
MTRRARPRQWLAAAARAVDARASRLWVFSWPCLCLVLWRVRPCLYSLEELETQALGWRAKQRRAGTRLIAKTMLAAYECPGIGRRGRYRTRTAFCCAADLPEDCTSSRSPPAHEPPGHERGTLPTCLGLSATKYHAHQERVGTGPPSFGIHTRRQFGSGGRNHGMNSLIKDEHAAGSVGGGSNPCRLRRPPLASRGAHEGEVPVREPANRANHADDERLVFWDADKARSSESTLSAPAATWQQARSTSSP